MKVSKKYDKSRQLQIEDYLEEDGWEIEDNLEVPSISFTTEEGRNDGNVDTGNLLGEIVSPANLNQAFKRVMANKGSHGTDGMKVDKLLQYLKENGETIKQQLLDGSYMPKPVRRVAIPKPDGGKRLLGIPTVVDRVIQQAIFQVLSPIYEKKFLNNSYGFRPNRNARQAVLKCKEYIEEGYTWAVDIDLAKYFDTVNHDKLMRLISNDIKDKRVIALVRKYLKSGVMENGMFVETEQGCPQGGNLSPLLSNIMLNELDKELEKRGLKYCRYADDCNIYVKSRKAALRVMKSITNFIENKLKLKVNKDKSAVNRPWKLKFLGFTFYHAKGGIGVRVHPKSIKKFKEKLKGLTMRSNAKSIVEKLMKLKQVIIGWVNYYGIADFKSLAREFDEWLRSRIRMCIWKAWKKVKTRHDNLERLGISSYKAWEYANTRKGYWRTAHSPILCKSLTNEYLEKLGYQSILKRFTLIH